MKTKEIKMKLGKNLSEEIFYNALCNGLSLMQGYELEFSYDIEEYKKSRNKLENPCWEEVLMQMLKDGYKLTLIDEGCEGEYTRSITIEDVHERVENTELPHLINMINEQDDCNTADAILQTTFFEEIIFG
ncbi:MAG: hypothetical protein WCO54_08860 [Bacteroidota bacterium]